MESKVRIGLGPAESVRSMSRQGTADRMNQTAPSADHHAVRPGVKGQHQQLPPVTQTQKQIPTQEQRGRLPERPVAQAAPAATSPSPAPAAAGKGKSPAPKDRKSQVQPRAAESASRSPAGRPQAPTKAALTEVAGTPTANETPGAASVAPGAP